MKRLRLASLSLSIGCILALMAVPRAMSEPGSVENAKVLFDAAKKSQQERKRAAKQKELERISEDMKKGKQEAADLEQSISLVGNEVSESKSNLDVLAGRKKSALHDLELLFLRSEAEKLKAEGLTLLNSANTKAMEALTKRNEELDLKATLISVEIQKLAESGKVGESDSKRGKTESGPSLTELRRNLAKAQEKSSLADYRAREAMEAASLKLQQAEAVAAKVEKKQAEFGLDKPNAPLRP